MRISRIPSLLPLVTFRRHYFLTRQQTQKKPWGKPHGSDFPAPCSLCHRLPQRLCITVCDYPLLLISWSWSHSSNSSWILRAWWKEKLCWAGQLSENRNVFQTEELMLHIPWGAVLWQLYHIARAVSGVDASWQTGSDKPCKADTYLVCLQRTPVENRCLKMVLKENFSNLMELQQGNLFPFFFLQCSLKE